MNLNGANRFERRPDLDRKARRRSSDRLAIGAAPQECLAMERRGSK